MYVTVRQCVREWMVVAMLMIGVGITTTFVFSLFLLHRRWFVIAAE